MLLIVILVSVCGQLTVGQLGATCLLHTIALTLKQLEFIICIVQRRKPRLPGVPSDQGAEPGLDSRSLRPSTVLFTAGLRSLPGDIGFSVVAL